MSRKTGNPNNRKRNRLVESIDRRNLGYFNHIAYQIHAEQVPQQETDQNRNTGGSL
jgi:hypothetical protein